MKLLPGDAKLLIHLYMKYGTSVDRLPYSEEIKTITHKYNKKAIIKKEEYEIYWALMSLRKKGDLPTRS